MTIVELIERIREGLMAGRPVLLVMKQGPAQVRVPLLKEFVLRADRPLAYDAWFGRDDRYADVELDHTTHIVGVAPDEERTELHVTLAWVDNGAPAAFYIVFEYRPGDEQYASF